MKNDTRTLKSKLVHQTAAIRQNVLPEISDLLRRKLMIVLVMLSVSAGLLLAGAATEAKAAAEKIVFMSSVGTNNEIFIMNPDGTGRTNLTNHPAQDDFASLSKDGTKIVFSSGRTNDVYTMNPDGTNVTNVSNNGRSSEPSFSPDGTKIVFAYHDGFQAEIYIMNSDGTNQTRLTNDPGVDLGPSFSPDGTKIVWNAHRTGNYQIYIMNVNGTSQTRLTNHPGSDAAPSFSPDGTKIVFTSLRNNNVDIYIMNPDGTNQTNLTNNAAYDALSSFSPDGTKIAFVSLRDGNYEIYTMNANGTNQTRVTNDPVLDWRPSWGVINDSTPPVITPTVTGTLGSNGWYTSDVQISWSVTDAESTVSSSTGCGAQTVSTDTGGVTFTCSATSAGGTDSQNVTVKRDATAPQITFASRTAPNAAGWNNINVAVQWNCSDALSGVTSSSVTTIVSTEGSNQSALGICTDNAGNTAQNTQTGINIDKTAPQITFASRTAPNAAGWNNTNVTVNWSCSDALSGATSPSVSQTLTAEGANLSATGTCFDQAGNTAVNTQTDIKIDKTAPVINPNSFANITVNLPENSNAVSMVVNFPLPTASDNLSLPAVLTNPMSGSQFPVGTTIVTITATDAAGNQSFATFTVTVLYRFSWFSYSGLLLRETQLNQVTAGSDVPVRFTLSGNQGNPYSSPPTSRQISCSTFAPIGAATVINRYAPDPYYSSMFDFYQTTWRTQTSWRFTCRRLTLHLNDGTTKTLNFYFK